MNEYDILGGLHKIIDDDTNSKMKEWLDSHNVNYYLLYPLAAIEIGMMTEAPEGTENLLKRCVGSFIYFHAAKNNKEIYLKKFNTAGFKKYLKSYENELLPMYQNFRFSREINDINPFSKPRLEQEGEHKYKLTTSLVSDYYREEDFYFFGMDDEQKSKQEREMAMDLHLKFWNKIVLEQKKYEELISCVDRELYANCIKIIEKDLKKWESKVRSEVFDNPKSLALVIAYFYYHAMLKSIQINICKDFVSDIVEIGKECIMYLDKEHCTNEIAEISGLAKGKVTSIIDYLINDGQMGLLEFPFFEVDGQLVTIPSLILVNDWQFTIINGHYMKGKNISNREKTISTVTENRIEKTLNEIINISVAKTVPYSFTDENGENISSDIDYAIYDYTHNKLLIIEAKWIDKHYKDEIDKIYGKILQTLNSIYEKQIDKHKKFLQKRENIDFLFRNDNNYKKGLAMPEIYYLAVDKRNQMHIEERHMISEYMLIYFINKYINNKQLDLEALWKDINGLHTKVEYITITDDYYEIDVNDDVVLVEKADLYWR